MGHGNQEHTRACKDLDRANEIEACEGIRGVANVPRAVHLLVVQTFTRTAKLEESSAALVKTEKVKTNVFSEITIVTLKQRRCKLW